MDFVHDEFHFDFPLWLAWSLDDSGAFRIDDENAEPVVPLFTERELAQDFLDADPPTLGFGLQPINGPSEFTSLLVALKEAGCAGVVMDPSESRRAVCMPIGHVLKTFFQLPESPPDSV